MPDRVRDAVHRAQQVPGDECEVTAVAIAAVHSLEVRALFPEQARQPVPRDRRVGVVDGVQVIVEEQQGEEAAVGDDRGAVFLGL